MVKDGDTHRAVFIGEDTVSVTWMKVLNGRVFLQVRPWYDFFGIFPRWMPVLNNVQDILQQYEERHVLDTDEGRSPDRVRVYFFDLDTLRPYQSRMNPTILRRLENVSAERDYLYQRAMELQSYFERASMNDHFREGFKREFDFFVNQLRPGWTFNKDGDDKKGVDKKR